MVSKEVLQKIQAAARIWMLLDYDGTLADFAPTPDDVLPDGDLISLIEETASHARFRVAIISGRRLSHIQKLLPVEGILLAGSYGLEIRLPSGEILHREDFDQLRPPIEELKQFWAKLIYGKKGFYLEDKGWSIAIHARFASDLSAESVLNEAERLAQSKIEKGRFNLLGGSKFLEFAPIHADKGLTVAFLLSEYGASDELPVYLGDDDKDEKAFPIVKEHGGLTGIVHPSRQETKADFTLESPAETRKWLRSLLELK
jgi:trehalose 6-phosphate phosphatase